jgi:hypothetical protein
MNRSTMWLAAGLLIGAASFVYAEPPSVHAAGTLKGSEGVKSFVDCNPLETARSRSKVAFEKVHSPSFMRRMHWLISQQKI